MNFLAPLGLLGLLTLPIILILHLLRNRRELLAVPSLRLWYGLQQKKHGRLPRNIPLSLMLLLQIAAAVALTLALARPALSFLLVEPQQTIFILDTSTSMTAVEDGLNPTLQANQTRFEAARQVIQDHLAAMEEADTVALINLSAHPDILRTATGAEKAEILSLVNSLSPGGTGLDLPAALTLANGLVDPYQQSEIIVLTDGNYLLEEEELPAMLAPVRWHTGSGQGQGAPLNNQALLNVSARTLPDGRHRLFARVVNYSDAPVERTLRILADGNFFDDMTIVLRSKEEATRVWTLPVQAETAAVEIVEADALLLDNRADVLLQETARLRVALISDTPEILRRALQVQPGVELTVETPDILAGESFNLPEWLSGFDLAVFEGLPFDLTTLPQGNLWVVNPPLGHPLLPAENYVRNLRPDLETASPEFAGIDLSGVYFNRAPQISLPTWANVDLMGFPVDNPTGTQYPLVFHGTIENSQVVVWAFDMAESNLPARLALPLMTANTLSALLSPSLPKAAPVGEAIAINGNFSIETPAGRRLFLTSGQAGEASSFLETRQPGLYRVYNKNNVLVGGFAIQAGSALESNLMAPLNPDRLNITYVTGQNEADSDLVNQEFWPWLAGMALLMVTVEGWLAWRR